MNKTIVEISRAFPYTKITPYTVTVTKSVRTVLSQIFLNKLWIPDVLIDIIKDYLYISKEDFLGKFYKNCINTSFKRLLIDRHYLVDIFGRRRQSQVVWNDVHEGLQLQQSICVTCRRQNNEHDTLHGCCAMEMDDVEDGFLALEVELELELDEVVLSEEKFEFEFEFEEDHSYPSEQDEYDRDRYSDSE